MGFFKTLSRPVKMAVKRKLETESKIRKDNIDFQKRFKKEQMAAKKILDKKVLQARRKATEIETLKQIKKQARKNVQAKFNIKKKVKSDFDKLFEEL